MLEIAKNFLLTFCKENNNLDVQWLADIMAYLKF